MLGNIGLSGLVLIIIMAIIVFGPKKLPEIGKSLGKSLREFRDATNPSAASKEPESAPTPPNFKSEGLAASTIEDSEAMRNSQP